MLSRRTVGLVTPKLPDWQKLAISNAYATWDPNGIEAAGNLWTDTASGMEGSITKGSSYPDPGDAKGWSWLARDVNGRALMWDYVWNCEFNLREITPPTLTTDCYCFVGLANESALNSATVDAIGIKIIWTGGVRRTALCRVSNGTYAANVNAGDAAVRRSRMNGVARRALLDTQVGNLVAEGTDDAGVAVAAANNVGLAANIAFATGGQLYWIVAVGQDAATGAGAEAFEFAPFVFAASQPRAKWAPT